MIYISEKATYENGIFIIAHASHSQAIRTGNFPNVPRTEFAPLNEYHIIYVSFVFIYLFLLLKTTNIRGRLN